jgi:uncharacterized protein
MSDLREKERILYDHLGRYPRLAVALSGGVDSSFLLYAAGRTQGSWVIAVTALSELHGSRGPALAREAARQINAAHFTVPTFQMESEEFVRNSRRRCYICKKVMLEALIGVARHHGFPCLAHGANVDDEKDFRPGLEAAEELGVKAPLAAAGLSKQDVRDLAEQAGLESWNLPASGCLATRIPYDMKITKERLLRIENAEEVLRREGFADLRVRLHQDLAKIELPEKDILRIMEAGRRERIVSGVRKCGFAHVAVDLEGHRSGRLDRIRSKE